jgi:hypothetical protein
MRASSFCKLGQERFKQRFKARAQRELLALLFKHLDWIGCSLERIAQIRQPHEPKGVIEILCVANAEGDPAGIGNPVVFLCTSLTQKCIVDGARKRNIDDPARVDVPDFRGSKPVLPTSKTMWVNGNFRPRRYLPVKLFEAAHADDPQLLLRCRCRHNRFKWPYSWPSSKNLQSKQVGIKYRKIRTPAGTASPNFSGIRAARPVALGKV